MWLNNWIIIYLNQHFRIYKTNEWTIYIFLSVVLGNGGMCKGGRFESQWAETSFRTTWEDELFCFYPKFGGGQTEIWGNKWPFFVSYLKSGRGRGGGGNGLFSTWKRSSPQVVQRFALLVKSESRSIALLSLYNIWVNVFWSIIINGNYYS